MTYQVGCFQHLKKKVVVKFLWPYNIFYSDGIFFVCPSVIFFLCFFSFLFYSINYFAHSGVFGDLIYLVTRPFPSFGKRVSCWLN